MTISVLHVFINKILNPELDATERKNSQKAKKQRPVELTTISVAPRYSAAKKSIELCSVEVINKRVLMYQGKNGMEWKFLEKSRDPRPTQIFEKLLAQLHYMDEKDRIVKKRRFYCELIKHLFISYPISNIEFL